METIEVLRKLGLNAYEAAVYDALLRLDRAKVQDLARIVSVPRPQIYVALGVLMNLGLCRETRGRVSFYSAVSPAIAFRSKLRQEEQSLKAMAEAVRKLEEEHQQTARQSVPPQFVQVLKGPQIKRFIDDLAAQAKDEVLIFLKSAERQSDKSLEGAAQSEIGMMERGVRVRCLYEAAALEEARIIPFIERLAQKGEEGRVVPKVPLDMMIFDEHAAMFSLTTQQGDTTVFVFTHPDLMAIMKNSFMYLWDKGTKMEVEVKVKVNGFSPPQPQPPPTDALSDSPPLLSEERVGVRSRKRPKTK